MFGLFVMFRGCSTPDNRSSTFAMKMSLSVVAAPGSVLSGVPVPDAEAWKAMFLLSGAHVGEPPRVSRVCSVPSVFMRNRSEVLMGSPSPRFRLLSKTIFLPSDDKVAKPSPTSLSVRRRGSEPSGFTR
jgi:hypothetical protein